jgi:hypothetical protein
VNSELIVAVGGIILSVLTYFAGVWRTEKRHRTEDREIRLRRVFDQYMGYRRTNFTGGYDGLQRSGVSTLKSNAEIEEVCRLVVSHGEAHPLGSDRDAVFQGVDLVKLFAYSAEKRVNLVATRIQDVIRDSGSKAS